MWVVDLLIVQTPELGHPFSDKVSFRIEPL